MKTIMLLQPKTSFTLMQFFQKVTYSKNFNQLANIVTIPSEPRFYEVSERSKIRREIRIQEFFKLSTKESTSIVKAKYMRSFQEGLYRLIFAKN